MQAKYKQLAEANLSSVISMKNQMLEFFYNDDEFHRLVKWSSEQEVLKSVQANIVKTNSAPRSPLEIIGDQCTRTAEELAQSSVILCVYGNVNVGKSTFCNLLLGKKLLHVTNVQCTAVITTVSSAPEKSTNGKVLFEDSANIQEIIDRAENNQKGLSDIKSWKTCREVLLRLDNKRKELSSNLVALEDFRSELPIVSGLYPELRKVISIYHFNLASHSHIKQQENIFERIELNAPILGVADPGLSLMDCPGTLENDYLTNIAKSGVQISSIIFYVMDSFTELTDKETRFLSCQVRNGSFVFFIFNRNNNDSEDLLEQRISKIQNQLASVPEFSESPIYIINLLDAVEYVTESPNEAQEAKQAVFKETETFDDLLKMIMNVVQLKMRGMIFQFARSFFHLLHTHFLLLSKIISHKMRLSLPHRSSVRSTLFRKDTPTEIELKMTELTKQIQQLLSTADSRIESYKTDLAKLYQKIVSDLEPELHIIARKHKTRVAYEENGKSWIRNIIDNLKSKETSPFEEELYRAIMSHFAATFAREFADWITSIRLQFSKEILTEANGIQESVNSLRKELTKSDVTVEMDALLQQTEKHIGNMIAAQMSIAGPVVGLLATGVGVGVGAPLILVGAITGTIVTGGMLLLAGVAAAGLLSGLFSFGYIQKINHRNESDVRELVFTNAMTQLQKWPSSPGYSTFKNKALSSCVMVKELIQSTLMLSVVQVETLSKSIEVKSISYEDLCNFLYMRETLEEKIKDLCELIKEFDNKESLDLPSLFSQVQETVTRKRAKNRGTFATTSSTDEMVGCHYPECVICKQEFIHCVHLCAPCRVTLDRMGNYPCPACNKGYHMLVQNSAHLSTLENMFNLDEDDYVELQEAPEDWIPFYSNEKARLLIKLKQKSKTIDFFVSWFNETFTGAHSSELITTRNIINCFISTFITKLSPRNDVPELYRTILTECLQELVYPRIYKTLFTIYKQHFAEKDAKIVEMMEKLGNEGPSYYQNEIEWDAEAVKKFSRAIDCIRDFNRHTIPVMKLRSLVMCYQEFEKSIPEDFAVGADLLVPTLVYFLVQSKVPHLCALFALVLDALDHTELMKPDEEYLFVTIHSLVLEFPKICVRYANDSPINAQPLRI